MITPLHALNAAYRTKVSLFAERSMTIIEPGTKLALNWHHQAITRRLEDCFHGKLRRLVINQPPKTLKTHLISIAYVAWLLKHTPSLRIAIICYDEELASTQLRKVRQIMRSAWYRKLAPHARIRKEKDTEALIETTAGGEVRALSIQGGITGHGFDYIIIDDPMKASLAYSENERRNLEEVFSTAIANRWRDPSKGVLIVVMQRLHVDDFTAYLLRTVPRIFHLSIPAVAPDDMEFMIGDETAYLFGKGDLLEPERLTSRGAARDASSARACQLRGAVPPGARSERRSRSSRSTGSAIWLSQGRRTSRSFPSIRLLPPMEGTSARRSSPISSGTISSCNTESRCSSIIRSSFVGSANSTSGSNRT